MDTKKKKTLLVYCILLGVIICAAFLVSNFLTFTNYTKYMAFKEEKFTVTVGEIIKGDKLLKLSPRHADFEIVSEDADVLEITENNRLLCKRPGSLIISAVSAKFSDSAEMLVRLPSPKNLSKGAVVLKWNAVPLAAGYIVKINNIEYRTSAESYDLGSLPKGTYKIKIKAFSTLGLGKPYDSDYCKAKKIRIK